jgi:hypothetical protein
MTHHCQQLDAQGLYEGALYRKARAKYLREHLSFRHSRAVDVQSMDGDSLDRCRFCWRNYEDIVAVNLKPSGKTLLHRCRHNDHTVAPFWRLSCCQGGEGINLENPCSRAYPSMPVTSLYQMVWIVIGVTSHHNYANIIDGRTRFLVFVLDAGTPAEA